MKKQLAFCLLVTVLALSACGFEGQLEVVRGSGAMATESRTVEGIDGVTLATLGDLTIEMGDEEALIIEAEENLLPYFETRVRGGMLTIGTEPGVNLLPSKAVHYYLTVKSLDSVAVTSSGNIEAPAMTADRFNVSSSSSGDIHLAGLSAGSVDVEINSSGDVMIDEGQVESQEINIHSSGAYEADDVQCANARVEINSSGNATIWATDRVDARLTSSGNVNYYGDPDVEQSTSSSGKVVSLGDR